MVARGESGTAMEICIEAKTERSECASAAAGAKGLRGVPIESVDFLDAGVAYEQRSAVRSDARPVTKGATGSLKTFQTEEVLHFAGWNLHAEIAFLVVEHTVEV